MIMANSETKTEILDRLKTIEGHVRGIQRMVENDEYCINIMKQTLAVQRALHQVNALLLERHLNTCVTTAVRGDDELEKERVMRELMEVFQAIGKLQRPNA